MLKKVGIITPVLILAGIFLILSFSCSDKNSAPPGKMDQASGQTASSHQAHGEGQGTVQSPDKGTGEPEEEVPAVEIPPEKQQLIGVKTVEVAVMPLHKIIRTVGRVEYDERRLATINTKVEGWIEKLYADFTGKFIKKGSPLAEIYSPELLATQQEFINLMKWKKQSNDNELGKMLSGDTGALIEGARQRLRLFDISEKQIKRIEETGTPLRTLTIHSPVSGYVVQKIALQGMRVMPGDKLFDIADLSTVWILSDIYEYELPLVRAGQKAKISLSYFPEREFVSTLDFVYPSLSGDTKTAKARFTISNPGGQLKPQMFTNVEVKVDLGKKLAVPEDAIIDTGERKVVYVDKGEGYFEPREIVTGVRGEGLIEVRKGLRAGEKIASSGTFLIDSEAKLKNVAPVHKH